MKRAKARVISALLGILAIGILLAIIYFAILPIRFAVITIRFLSEVVYLNKFGLTDIIAILMAEFSILLAVFIYRHIICINIIIQPKKALIPAPAFIQQIFRNHHFADKKITKLQKKTAILCDIRENTDNAYVDKYNNIVVTNGFTMVRRSNDIIKAALFHELGHIVHKDNLLKRSILNLKRFIILICLLCAAFFYIVSIFSMTYLSGYGGISLLYKISILNGLIELIIYTLCYFLEATLD